MMNKPMYHVWIDEGNALVKLSGQIRVFDVRTREIESLDLAQFSHKEISIDDRPQTLRADDEYELVLRIGLLLSENE